MKTRWDYTDLAAHYDKRADYSDEGVFALLDRVRLDPDVPVADIGAGTAKLAKLLLAKGLTVSAVEPNGAMRAIGIKNTEGGRIQWTEGTGEHTGLPDATFQLATFGSSFNVVDRAKTLVEVHRILRPGGWFACVWNHRDLEDPLQKKIETAIAARIPDYSYGTRREDQTTVIDASGLFGPVETIEGRTVLDTTVEDCVEAWRSHATLKRQAGEKFPAVLDGIAAVLKGLKSISVPYVTRIWCARLREGGGSAGG